MTGQTMDWGHLFFAFNGRINRGKFWLAMLVLAVIHLIFYVIANLTDNTALDAVSGMMTIVLGILSLAVGVKRLHDRNKSGWYLVLFYIVPCILLTAGMVFGTIMEDSTMIANVLGLMAFAIFIWAFVELGCLRGTVGANQHGPDPVAPAIVPPVRTPA
jgi:uncharacterized membrane protein YhaH (DUF805 family)